MTTQQTTGEAAAVSSTPLLGAWTQIAIEHGGILHVVRNRHLKRYTATMLFPQVPDAEALEGTDATIYGALAQLEEAIVEDAADEMAANPMSGV